jgi:hypothetical protein
LSIIQLSVDDVYGVLLKLDISKCKWPWRNSYYCLEKLCRGSCTIVCILFSLATGYVPKEFKYANIIHIHKKGDHDNINNYRPTSILRTVGKILERCVHNII